MSTLRKYNGGLAERLKAKKDAPAAPAKASAPIVEPSTTQVGRRYQPGALAERGKAKGAGPKPEPEKKAAKK